MSKLHEVLLKECEVKLKVSQFQVVEAVNNMNINAEFYSDQLVEANLIISDLKKKLKMRGLH